MLANSKSLWSQLGRKQFLSTSPPEDVLVRYQKYSARIVIGVVLLTCFVCYDRSLSASSLAQANETEAIRSLVGRFFDLYQQKEFDKLIAFWHEKSPFLGRNKKALEEEFAAYEKIDVKGFGIRLMRIDGDKATVRVTVNLVLTKAKLQNMTEKIWREGILKQNRTIELVNQSGNWKVWKFVISEEELAAAIIAAQTEEERKALMEKEPELITSDLASALYSQILFAFVNNEVDYKRSITINELAYKLAERIGDRLVMAYVLIYTGYSYGWIGMPEKSPDQALEYFRSSLKIGEEHGFKDVVLRSVINSAILHQGLGELTHAEEYYQRGLKLLEEVGSQDGIIQVLSNLGTIHQVKGNYATAFELFLKSLKMSESQLKSGVSWGRRSNVLINIAGIFTAQANFEQALAYYQMALEAAEKGIMLGDIEAKSEKFHVLMGIGNIYLQQGNHSLAMDYFKKSQKLIDEFVDQLPGSKDSYTSMIKKEMADVLAAEHNLAQAIANYKEALQLADKAEDKVIMTYQLLGLGEMYFLTGDFREALSYSERASEAAEKLGQYPYMNSALVVAAKAYQKLGQQEKSRQALIRAIYITEELLEHSTGDELDLQRSFERAVAPYQAMIDFEVDQKRFIEAFSYAQRTKGRTLLELLQNGRVDIKAANLFEREKEQQLNRKIVSLNREITAEKLKSNPNEKRLVDVEEQLKKARLEFERFHTTLYAAHPDLKVQRGEIRPVTFDDAAGLIPDSQTAMMDFIVTDENVHLFVLSKDGAGKPILNTYTFKIERKSLAEKVERYRRRMENRDYDFQALSQELYGLLIKPAHKQLQGKTNLIISPDSVLWDLPFQTLMSPELRYLIEDAAISYTPSLSVLREMQLAGNKKQARAKSSLLALGNPALGNRSKELVKFVKMDAELQPLPEAAAQVRALEGLYGKTRSRVLTGAAAREELVKEQSGQYHIVHLATHGILNDVSPMYSHVMLSQTAGKSEEDGLLEAWEMMNLDLNADLVVLAGCETARGRVGAGEGVIGMTWALFVAGCPRTVVSQWKVEASSTTDLMVEFHKKFKTRYGDPQRSVSTAESMRQAALRVMRNPEYVHPFYWGGFVVIGDGN